MSSATRGAAAGILLAAVAALVAYLLGESYPTRMSDLRPSHVVTVADRVAEPPPRPRRTVVVVADGLRRDAALGMRSVARLRAAGQCRTTDVGAITISRPSYAVISTGVEPDRTGVHDNNVHAPLALQSIWEVARAAGLVVVARSEVAWWKELFPAGFDHHELLHSRDPHFRTDGLGDLTLIHPSWVDVAGHNAGGDSEAYAIEVRGLDARFGRFLDSLDLGQDLVVFTADHGHTGRGGHGGRTSDVALVLTCFAGRGVAHLDPDQELRPMMTLDLAPAIAVLLGLPFPRNMRARGDDLDVIWQIVDARAFPGEYLDDRRAAVARFRAANPPWPEIYEAGRDVQGLKMAILASLCAAVACAAAGRRRGAILRALGTMVFMAGTVAAAIALHLHYYGSFDLSAVNKRPLYQGSAPGLMLGVAAAAFAVRLAAARDLGRAVADLAALAGAGLLVNLGLVWMFGVPLGFPLPTAPFLFLPIFAAFLTIAAAVVLGLVCLLWLAFSLRRWMRSARSRIYSSP